MATTERPVLRLLLDHLARAGWTPDGVHDGGELFKVHALPDNEARELVEEIVFSVDESRIFFRKTVDGVEREEGIRIILGNEPDGSEMVNDYTMNTVDFQLAMDEFNEILDNAPTMKVLPDDTEMASEEEIHRARLIYQIDGEVEVDGDAKVSRFEGGCWVAAWVRITNEDEED